MSERAVAFSIPGSVPQDIFGDRGVRLGFSILRVVAGMRSFTP
jgi:hypothetical protein